MRLIEMFVNTTNNWLNFWFIRCGHSRQTCNISGQGYGYYEMHGFVGRDRFRPIRFLTKGESELKKLEFRHGYVTVRG